MNPKTKLIAVIGLGAILSFQTGCRKSVSEFKPAKPEIQPAKPVIQPTKAERIAEIDAQLAHWVPTGRPEDADNRAALRSERAKLATALGLHAQTTPVRRTR
jgi:hypothetical protein